MVDGNERDPLPVSVRALLLGAVALQVVHPAHARVLGDEAVDSRLIHEGALRLAAASLASRALGVLKLLLQLLVELRINLRRRAGVLFPTVRAAHVAKT